LPRKPPVRRLGDKVIRHGGGAAWGIFSVGLVVPAAANRKQ
jgi:hypothetical protein